VVKGGDRQDVPHGKKAVKKPKAVTKTQGGDRQDVPHESVSEDFLGSAWAALIIFFWPRVASFLRPPRPLHGRREDAQY
jgi:hypothetical protein